VNGASELDLDYPTVVIINEDVISSSTPTDQIPAGASISKLNSLSFEDNEILLHHLYKHLNIITFRLSEFSFTRVNQEIEDLHKILKNRMVRMKSWVGLNNHNSKNCPCLHSMTNCLNIILQGDHNESIKLREFVTLINKEVSFFSLLTIPKPHDFYKYCIGNWGFIAHELTCDELIFCAFLIFQHAFSILDSYDPLILSDNDILSFLFSLRDSYRGGNSFHNFRHAVDVLQATFYFLLRIRALPTFAEYTTNLHIHPSAQFSAKEKYPDVRPFDYENSLLHPIQSLALLVSSAGHDVGHPGLNNPFLINNKSPIAKIYSNRSVLENYHSTIFQNILTNHWPIFLDNANTNDAQNALNTKVMQVDSIIATDMANHVEYILKVEEISNILSNETLRLQIKNNLKQTNIILSLIIKCADISNVARPLLISAKWATFLAREFGEIAQLGEHLQTGSNIDDIVDPRKAAYFPSTIVDALVDNPLLYKGQLFFIDQFADSLFKEVATVLPELTFSAQIVFDNKAFWQKVENGEDISSYTRH
jgi:3',5'-cyclic-nucleotide phosphodiesterase